MKSGNMVIAIPVELIEYKNAVNIGLFYLVLGYRPKKVYDNGDDEKSVRIKISPKAQEYYNIIELYPEFNGVKKKIITTALAFVAEKPELKNVKL
ncbi:MAG: hypothetical protein JRJ49_03520 [Deltaproteobacteria bacterium]|nr:hypothetical protein [Deltaproteobacteria bacterium]